MDEPREITRDQYLKAHALLHMAQAKLKEVNEYEREIADVLGIEPDETGYFGHVSDGIYESYTIRTLLQKSKLKVKK
jgi:hypothetical protein